MLGQQWQDSRDRRIETEQLGLDILDRIARTDQPDRSAWTGQKHRLAAARQYSWNRKTATGQLGKDCRVREPGLDNRETTARTGQQ